MNSTQLGKLTEQYSNRKRRSTTPPEDLPSNKKSKKWRTIFQSSTDQDVRGSRSEGEDSAKGYTEPTSTGKKKLVLLPPKRTDSERKTCVRCHRNPEYGFLLACMICYRKMYCSVYCKVKRDGRNCSSVCRPEEDPIAFLNNRRPSNSSSQVSSALEHDNDTGDSSSSSDEEVRLQMGMPRESPERDMGDEVELSNSLGWDIVDFRISKCGRCLIYVFEHVTTRERKSFPADLMIGGDWPAKVEVFWLDNEDAWRKREAFESPFGGVKHVNGTQFGRMILSARFDSDRFLDFNIRDHESREPDEDDDCTEYQLASLLEADWDDLIRKYWRSVEVKQDWDRRAEIIKNTAAFRDFSHLDRVQVMAQE